MTMKIWRTGQQVDLRDLPLDSTDTFLLTRIEGTISLAELEVLSGCDHVETIRRVEQLVTFGLLQTDASARFEFADTNTMPAPALVRRAARPH